MSQPLRSFQKNKLKVEVYESEAETGGAAADNVFNIIQSALQTKGSANLILATGTSQFFFWKLSRRKILNGIKLLWFT